MLGLPTRYDSLHSDQTLRAVVDDIDADWGFRTFTHASSGHPAMIRETEPLRSDPRRFNEKESPELY